MNNNDRKLDLTAEYESRFGHYRSYAKRLLHNEEDAPDASQEAFARAWQYRHTIDQKVSDLGPWLHKIIFNVCQDMNRNRLNLTRDDPDTIPEDWDLDSTMNAAADMEAISLAIDEASDLHQQAFHMYFILGCKPKDISEVLGMKVGTLKQALWRFKKQFEEDQELAKEMRG